MRDFRMMGMIMVIITLIAAVPPIVAPTTNDTVSPVSPSGAHSSSGSPSVIKHPIDNATAYLAINESQINTTTIESLTLGAGGIIMISTQKIERAVSTERFEATIRNASDKQAVINAALARVANRTDELRARQTAAIQAYNNGELSMQALLRTLSIIGEKAHQQWIYVENIKNIQYNSDLPTRRYMTYLKHELTTLMGPVRRDIQSVLHGESSAPQRYFVRTSAKGVVIATIDNNRYIREVYLAGARTAPNTSGGSPLRRRWISLRNRIQWPKIGPEKARIYPENMAFTISDSVEELLKRYLSI